MKLTIDSSEPLEDAIRVVGSLYGVTLAVSNDHHPTKPATPRKATPRKRPTKPTPGRRRAIRSAAPSNGDIRSWARQAGMTVSDRGRVPAAVMSAYRKAH